MNPTGDALSDVLRMVQLKTCVYFVADMPAPWGMDIPASTTGPLHMVLHGRCIFRCGEENIELNEGDAILLPRGSSHQMLDSITSTPEPASQLMPQLYANPTTDNTGDFTRMLCGHFEWDGEIEHALFRELPEYLIIRSYMNQSESDVLQFKNLVSLIKDQSVNSAPGNSAIADRLGEILFITLLKSWMMDNATEQGLLATINDERLARALRYIHQNAEQEMDIQELARVAGMSRTSFAVQFREAMGTTPAAYLAEWRLLKARRLLIGSDVPLGQLPDRVGYGTDASFARAYRRRFNESPSTTRRRLKQSRSASYTSDLSAGQLS